MRIGDRVLLIIAMLLCIAACAYLFAIVWGLLPLYTFMRLLSDIANTWYYRIGVSALLLLLAIAFAKLMFIHTGSQHVLLQEGIPINSAGDVRITVDALRQLCEEVAKADNRVDLTDCAVSSSQQGLLIAIKAQCKGEQNIALIVEALQESIQQMLRQTCGIATAKIQVLVEKAAVAKPQPTAQVFDTMPQPTNAVVTTDTAEKTLSGEGQNNG